MIPIRLARELTYQLDKAGEYERMAKTLSLPAIFVTLGKLGELEVAIPWNTLAKRGYPPEKYFDTDVTQLGSHSSTSAFLSSAANLFWRRGNYDLSLEFSNTLISIAEANGDKLALAIAALNMANNYWHQGQHEEAFQCYERSRDLAEELGDKLKVSNALCHIGIVHYEHGRYEEASKCYERSFELAEKLGNKHQMAVVLVNTGLIYHDQHRNAEAATLYSRCLKLFEELGDKRGMTHAIGNMGVIHSDKGNFKDALECYERWLMISEELGDKLGIVYATGNIGIAHVQQGQYLEAARFYMHARELAEELGDKQGQFRNIGNMGRIHLSLGRYDEALASYREALEGHRVLIFKYGMTHWYDGIAETLLESGGDISEARKNAEECLSISEDLKKPDTIHTSKILLARCDAVEGNTDLAVQKLNEMRKGTTDEEQMADIHYWLWKISGNENDRNESLARYNSLWQRIKKFIFHKRLAELKGERVPLSADELVEKS